MGWFKQKPAEAVFGVGSVITGAGRQNGRAFVFIRPVEIKGVFGLKLPEQTVSAKRGDIVLWLENEEGAQALCETIMRTFTHPTKPTDTQTAGGEQT